MTTRTLPAPVWAASGSTLTPSAHIGEGREGEVFAIAEDPHVAVKLYHAEHDMRAQRISELLAHRASSWVDGRGRHVRLAWPLGEALDDRGRVVGYAMVRLSEPRYVPLSATMSRDEREDARLDLWWPDLLEIAASLAAAVRVLHARGLTFGDLSRENVLVQPEDRAAILIDCDGVAPDGWTHPADLFTDDTAAPELLEHGSLARSQATDLWALAVLVCQLLMEGSHPFSGDPVGLDPDLPWSAVDNVASGRSRFAPAGLQIAADAVPLHALPPAGRELAVRCFVDGAMRRSRRPSAFEWEIALAEAARSTALRLCPNRERPRHMYAGQSGCPWCAMIAAGAPDPFPGPPRRRRGMRFIQRGRRALRGAVREWERA
jgi:DNA-binding helix-hairpin-helix protein with protein kinase domain